MQRGSLIIYDNNGKIWINTGDVEGDILHHEYPAGLPYIETQFRGIEQQTGTRCKCSHANTGNGRYTHTADIRRTTAAAYHCSGGDLMLNQTYVNWLVGWIRNGTINIKTGLPFAVYDILITEYKTAVQAALTI